jgi:hypothetical protein
LAAARRLHPGSHPRMHSCGLVRPLSCFPVDVTASRPLFRCLLLQRGRPAHMPAYRAQCGTPALSVAMTVHRPGTRRGLAPRQGVTYLRNDAMGPSWRPTEGSFNANT